MSMHNIHFHNKKNKILKISLNIWFLEPSENFLGLKNEFESARVNEPLMFESLKFYCRSVTIH